jgi:type I restriction enzyme M protein
MSEEQKKKLQQQLWNIADTLRGKMHADEFRDYILGFIFYKYLSEKMLLKANELLKHEDIKDYSKIDENTEEGKEILKHIKENTIPDIGYFLRPTELFSYLAKKWNSRSENESSNFILPDLQKVLVNIQNSTTGTESEDDFDDLFSDLDLTSQKLGKTEDQKNELISKVLFHLDQIDFQLQNAQIDVLGDAYEYLIGQFASSAGKKAGEFYTPQEVSRVLAKIVTSGKTRLKSVYDPTCGSGSLLLRVAREVNGDVTDFYGQEMNRTTYNLARMNLILHDVSYQHFDIQQEDTLEHPLHLGKKFEAIVANPPFSAQWKADSLKMSDDRFSQYGELAPSSKADFAFVQHMIHHLDDNGTMAVVLPHGALFRGGVEQRIRKYLIDDRNYLDAVIGLPANLFYGTSIPACIMVFRKCRENPDNVLFIDASTGFEKSKNQNILREEHIEKIISTYRNRETIEKYSHVAPLSEIIENDYNLNISRYVDTFEEEKNIDINAVATEIREIDESMHSIDESIRKYCIELGIKSPF